MKQIEILATAPLIPGVMQTLDDTYVVQRLWEAPDCAALLAEHGSRIRGIATNGSVGAGAALLDQLPALEIISCFGVGVDAIDLASAARRGIAVTTTPGVLVEDVADQALALLLADSRNIVAADRHVREGKWAFSELALTRRVSGKKAGILGLGDIGKVREKSSLCSARTAPASRRSSSCSPASTPLRPVRSCLTMSRCTSAIRTVKSPSFIRISDSSNG